MHLTVGDLTVHCEKFVPREEVEKALHAIVVQVKSLKVNSVELPVMKEVGGCRGRMYDEMAMKERGLGCIYSLFSSG